MSEKFDHNDPDAQHTIPSVDIKTEHIDIIRGAVAKKDGSALVRIFKDEHPADIADRLEQLSIEERVVLAGIAAPIFSADVLAELEDEVVEAVLPLLEARQISKAVIQLDSDDAIQIFEELDEKRRAEVLAALPAREREEVVAGFSFDEDTAGRLMQREFVAAPDFWSVEQTVERMREQGKKGSDNLPDLFFDIYIVDTRFHPVGYIPLSTLMCTGPTVTLSEITKPNPAIIDPKMDQEDVAYLFEKYDLISAPVIDVSGRLSGMITVDDVVGIIHEENKEDMLALAGVSDAGLVDTALSTVKARAPWLFVNLLTAIGASIVISLFRDSISQLVALAVLMPIVASLGGNTGTQALTVAIRALATRDLTPANTWQVIRREAGAALINGFVFATLLAGITYFWFGSVGLALVIAAALVFNLFCAGLAGILVPLGLKRFGADPAVASSVFVTTVSDVIGFFVFLGLASVFLL